MSSNILITGAAGYIGGSVLAELISQQTELYSKSTLFAAVRSAEQVDALAKLGVNPVQVDLSDEVASEHAIVSNDINVIIHTASAFTPAMASHLLKALGKYGKQSGKQTYFIHSSVSAMFTPEGGWKFGQAKDSDSELFEKEKQMIAEDGPHLVRDTNVIVAGLAEELGIASYNVVVPNVYGRGSGEVRKLSVKIPGLLRENIASRTVHKYKRDAREVAVHIDDLTSLYLLILNKALGKESLPGCKQGYYFAFAHRTHWWEVMDLFAKSLSTRGLVDTPVAQIWSSDEEAASRLGLPATHISTMLSNTGDLVAENPYLLGWKPLWDEKKFIENLDDEIRDILEVDTVKPTLFANV